MTDHRFRKRGQALRSVVAPPALRDGEERRYLKPLDAEDADAALVRARTKPWGKAVVSRALRVGAVWMFTVEVRRLA